MLKGIKGLKILIICNCASGLDTFRGMLIRELIKKKNIVKAVVPLSKEEKEISAESRLEKYACELQRIPIDRRGINPVHDLKLMRRYKKVIQKENPDLVITYTIKPNIYGGLVCRNMKVPYIANITGLGTTFQKDGLLKKIVSIMYKAALNKAKLVFFENVENRNLFVELKLIPYAQTHVLKGAGVDLEVFSYYPYPPDDGKTRFLFIGRVMREKGIDELLHAMERLHNQGYNCSLDILGGFEENYQGQLDKCQDGGWLHYHGYQDDVKPFIQRSHCFVLPSWHEGMANTNLECASCGRPVITSNIHGCLEAVEDGISGFLVKKGNIDDLYNVMKRFIELSYEQKAKMGEAGRKRMELYFDKKKVVAETISLINENNYF